jgi:hypothetical protein
MKLTILNRPIMTHDLEGKYYLLREWAIKLKKIIATKKIPKKKKYRGHYTITRSLVEGLQKLGTNFNYDPESIADVGDIIVVMSNLDALRQAINLKKTGKTKKIIAGPNITSLPTDITKISSFESIDLCIFHGQWFIEWWEHLCPNFPIQKSVWYAGVDTDFWQPLDSQPQTLLKRVLIYQKYVSDDFTNKIKNKIHEKGLQTQILKYGKYNLEEYKNQLKISDIMLFLSPSETQGVALFESWACNVPTLVWNPGIYQWPEKGYSTWQGCSSAPYLSEMTGCFFKSFDDFEPALEKMMNNFAFFSPREWILTHGSDQIAASNLLNLIDMLSH